MENERRLKRFTARFSRLFVVQVPKELEQRVDESAKALRLNALVYNRSRTSISKMHLGEEADLEISTAVRSAMSAQSIMDDIQWRRALNKEGISLEKIVKINEQKDALSLELEIEAPRFSNVKTKDSI